MTAENRITDIHCRKCGAPASFDIVLQKYACPYCGSETGIDEAVREKQGYRMIQRGKMKQAVRNYRLFHAECSGCGADIVMGENEALADCPFCSRALVRREYLYSDNMPESLIPFALTQEEAQERMLAWCSDHSRRPEAKLLKKNIGDLQGIYLPYELVRGPVHMRAGRMDSVRTYRCEGFVDSELISRTGKLDNLLLDGMEPFDTDALREFDFAFAAGQRIRIADMAEDSLKKRIEEETAQSYLPYVRRTLQTKAVEITADAGSVIRLPVLLPVYYLAKGDLMAAVNGQTGKVSVRSLSAKHYYFTPWWLKALIGTLVLSLAAAAGLRLFGMNMQDCLLITGVLALFFIVVLLCLYSDTVHNSFSVESGKEIFTSGEKTFVRERGRLVLRDELLERKTVKPVFFETINGKPVPVELKFATVPRALQTALYALAAIFLPVIIALFLNGFQFRQINFGGAAVWFCIMVPVVPVIVLKYGVAELYERPWMYVTDEKGRKKRFRDKKESGSFMKTLGFILKALIIPPACFAIWAAIGIFILICWLTAFGF